MTKDGGTSAMHALDAQVLAAINGTSSGPQSPFSSTSISPERLRSWGKSLASGLNAGRGGMKRRDRRSMALAGLGAMAVAGLFLALSAGGNREDGSGMSGPSVNAEDKPFGRALTNGAVPAALAHHLADVDPGEGNDGDGNDDADAISASDVPTFWHVLKAGGTAVQDLCEDCFALRVASEVGAANGYGEEDELRIVEVNEGHRHVNVDATELPGIQRAGQLGLASSGLVDVLFTPLLVETAENVYGPEHRGRMFALFRHPVHRAASQFYYLRNAEWEPTYNPEFRDMTLEEYAFTPYVESNWMVRSLVQKMEGPLTEEDLEGAKEIIRIKCLVGLLDRMEESVERFRRYFGFGYTDKLWIDTDPKVDECVQKRLGGNRGNRNDHPVPVEGGDAWKELERKNGADMVLYQYVRRLFEEQYEVVEREVRRRRRRARNEGLMADVKN